MFSYVEPMVNFLGLVQSRGMKLGEGSAVKVAELLVVVGVALVEARMLEVITLVMTLVILVGVEVGV